ncbi:uncharacterized protein TRIADDRAFT_53823 [Trichoplax adhaerens]|uniref:Death domain-containing protein n=1 Tax=Trichoplax adhaerens TaxID=10228 RepID=B3RQ95_TRIAD|nr:hypothetical protein TRIADDRAFT_53823 [Trichoplax adhaerens]EDV27787.1 hypothetical protein TRIADDRAFT_53823 [Trichoplax adhaerens]|eukprot:XP_002109621.1 hypothetical protein TRIADDRAFT_53823 [Trichoplax adhaerens]
MARETFLAEQCLSFNNQIQDLIPCTFIHRFHQSLKKVTRRWRTHYRRSYGRIRSIQDVIKLAKWERRHLSTNNAICNRLVLGNPACPSPTDLQMFCDFCSKIEELRQRFTHSIYQPLLDFFYDAQVGGRKLIKIANILEKIVRDWDRLLNTDQIQPKYFSSCSATWKGLPKRDEALEYYDILRLLPDLIEKAFEALRLARQWRQLLKSSQYHNPVGQNRTTRRTDCHDYSDSSEGTCVNSPSSNGSPVDVSHHDKENHQHRLPSQQPPLQQSYVNAESRNSSDDSGRPKSRLKLRPRSKVTSINQDDQHRKQLKKIEKELKASKKKCNHLEKQLKAAMEACENLQSERDRAETECQQLRQQLQQSKQQLQDTTARLERTDCRNRFLEDEINRAMQRMHSSDEQLMRATNHVKWLRKELERTRQRSGQLEKDLEYLHERMQGLKLELDSARNKQHSLHGNLQLLQRLEDFHELTGAMEPRQLSSLRTTLSDKLEVVQNRSRSIEDDLDNCLTRCNTLQSQLDVARARERVVQRIRHQSKDQNDQNPPSSNSPLPQLEQLQQKQGISDRCLTEFQLNEIARIIRDYWKDLGRSLGLSESDLVSIENDHQGSTHEQKYAVLLTWRDKLGPQATVRQLIAAMLRINQQFDANIILMTCSASS